MQMFFLSKHHLTPAQEWQRLPQMKQITIKRSEKHFPRTKTVIHVKKYIYSILHSRSDMTDTTACLLCSARLVQKYLVTLAIFF